uniref:PLD phosphodiesterase domain-containing protein n=1 Tax=Globodera pallida TaxID=36090 RepID=A0A183BYH3_GLOPA
MARIQNLRKRRQSHRLNGQTWRVGMPGCGWETKDGRADMTNFEMDLFDTRVYRRDDKDESDECCRNSIIKPACFPITILALLLLMTFFVPMLNEDMGDAAVSSTKKYERTGTCTDECRQAWTELLRIARKSVDITALYWNMRDKTNYKTSWQGKEVFGEIIKTAQRGVTIRVAQNAGSAFGSLDDLKFLEKEGVLHTKLWVIDNRHFYLGSANMDWQSLTEVKEMEVEPKGQRTRPFGHMLMHGQSQRICSNCCNGLYSCNNLHAERFWPPIDDAIRTAAYRGVKVELLVSLWPHSNERAIFFFRSLLEINAALPPTKSGKSGGISIKYFRVPVSPEQAVLRFARVNHNKFMVTDTCAWIGTSNWSGDYFINTAGVGIVIHKEVTADSVVDQLNAVFERDWTSRKGYDAAISGYLLGKALAPLMPRSAKELAETLADNVLYHAVGDILVLNKPYGVGSLGYVQKNFGIFRTTQYKFKDRMDFFDGVRVRKWVSGPVVLPCSENAFKKIQCSLYNGESISHSNEQREGQHMHRAMAITISRPPKDEGLIFGYATFQDTRHANESKPRSGQVLDSRHGLSLIDVHFSKFSRHFPRLILSHLGSPIFGDWLYERRLLDVDGLPVAAEPKDMWRGGRKFEPSAFLAKTGLDSLEQLRPRPPLFLTVYQNTLPFFGDTNTQRRKTNLVSRAPPFDHFMAMVDLLNFRPSVEKLLKSLETEELDKAEMPHGSASNSLLLVGSLWSHRSLYERRLLDVDGLPVTAEPKDMWRGGRKFEPSAFLAKTGLDSLEQLRPRPPLFLTVYQNTLPFFGDTNTQRRKTNLVSRAPPFDHFMAMVDLLNFRPSVEKLLKSLETEELDKAEMPSTDDKNTTKSGGDTKF